MFVTHIDVASTVSCTTVWYCMLFLYPLVSDHFMRCVDICKQKQHLPSWDLTLIDADDEQLAHEAMLSQLKFA